MTTRLPSLALLVLVSVPTAGRPSPPPREARSPTGVTPKLLWTPRRQAVWDRMRAEDHPWWRVIRENAERTGTPRERYHDYGQWCALAYQVTGDRRYAARAWSNIEPRTGGWTPPNANWVRENFIEHVILYDRLRPALTADQRAAFIESLNLWADRTLGRGPGAGKWGGVRTADSDVTVGSYFALALIDLATAPDNPRAGSFLEATWKDSGTVKPVGGLVATGANRDTMRNAIADYVRMAEGGQWIESGQYNLNTLRLLMLGSEGVRTATGRDYFPEVTRYLPQAALAQLYELTPDLKAAYQWGDDEHPRAFASRLFKRLDTLGMLAGLTEDDPDVGPYLNRLFDELVAGYQPMRNRAAQPDGRLFNFYDPYAPRSDWRPALPAGHFSSGIGLLHVHPDWRTDGSLFAAFMPTRLGVDHEVKHFGSFQLYRRGEWAITHPLGYGGEAYTGFGTNAMVFGGLSSMWERGPVAQETDPRGRYAYLAGTTRGPSYGPSSKVPPPAFLHEWTRSLVYMPADDRHSDMIVVFDRVRADDPRRLPQANRYRPPDRKQMEADPTPLQWIIHAPVEPTVTPETLAWSTPGGQRVVVRTLLPEAQSRTVVDESRLWAASKAIRDPEKKWQVRITPDANLPWETFLNVIQVHDGKPTPGGQIVRGSDDKALGALVPRGGSPDALVLFGARPEGRVLAEGYRVDWTPSATKTDAYLFDLDADRTWQVAVDGGGASPLTVSGQGVARLVIDGGGPHALTLSATPSPKTPDRPALPRAPVAPSRERGRRGANVRSEAATVVGTPRPNQTGKPPPGPGGR